MKNRGSSIHHRCLRRIEYTAVDSMRYARPAYAYTEEEDGDMKLVVFEFPPTHQVLKYPTLTIQLGLEAEALPKKYREFQRVIIHLYDRRAHAPPKQHPYFAFLPNWCELPKSLRGLLCHTLESAALAGMTGTLKLSIPVEAQHARRLIDHLQLAFAYNEARRALRRRALEEPNIQQIRRTTWPKNWSRP